MYEAYAAVERAYSQGRFEEALNQAQGLLASLSASPDDPLRPRLQLLVGHCHLYGLANPQLAVAAYREVLERCGEPVLREIAEQGLGRCATSTPASTPASIPSTPASPAMPWLEQLDSGAVPAAPAPAATAAAAAFAPFQSRLEAPAAAVPPESAEPATPATVPPSRPPSVPPEAAAEPEFRFRPAPVPEPETAPEPEASVQPEPQPELIIPEVISPPEPPARPSSGFSREEEEDLARGLLLVEL